MFNQLLINGIIAGSIYALIALDTYTRKSENLSLTFSEMSPINLPSPRREGMKGRGDPSVSVLSTPTRTLPRRRGGNYLENFKYLWIVLAISKKHKSCQA